jgi:hypothetical protein
MADQDGKVVIWNVMSPGVAELPGTGRYISDLVRDFLKFCEQEPVQSGARVEVLFG